MSLPTQDHTLNGIGVPNLTCSYGPTERRDSNDKRDHASRRHQTLTQGGRHGTARWRNRWLDECVIYRSRNSTFSMVHGDHAAELNYVDWVTSGTSRRRSTIIDTDLSNLSATATGGILDTNGNSILFGSSKWSIELRYRR